MSETGDLISRIYANFRGADFRGEEINLTRSPECLNVWRDYREIESIRTRPGLKQQTAFSDAIYGIFFYKDMQIVHSGTKLYKVVNGFIQVQRQLSATDSFTTIYGTSRTERVISVMTVQK